MKIHKFGYSILPFLTSIAVITKHASAQTVDDLGRNSTSSCFGAVAISDLRSNFAKYENQEVKVCEAYVTAIVYNGFFIQDGMASKSGLFVFTNDEPTNITPGNKVEVMGEFESFFGNLQISETETTVVEGSETFDATILELPVKATSIFDDYQGMLVEFVASPGKSIVVSEYFNLDRWGEILVCAAESNVSRLYSFTQLNEPDVDEYDAHREMLRTSCVTIDDNSSIQNPKPIMVGGVYVTNSASTFRGGTKLTKLKGPLWFSFGKHRVATLSTSDLQFDQSTNVRQEAPILPSSGTKIAVSNLLNYWTTVGPARELRGADSFDEFQRQYTKTVLALNETNADVYALVELENGFNSSIDLKDKLNTASGKSFQSASVELGYTSIGSDVIKCDVFYDTMKYKLLSGKVFNDTDVPESILNRSTTGFIFNGASRAPIAVTFEDTAGELFTIVVNHYKSKGNFGGDASGEDADLNNGNAHYNLMRTLTSEAIIEWINNDDFFSSNDNIIIAGDLNSYKMEAPVQYLIANGFVNTFDGNEYSYVFDGQVGTLDYALVKSEALKYVSASAVWNVNADEPDLIDYNLNFGRDPSLFDASIPERFSDHDVVLLVLDFNTNKSLSVTSRACSNPSSDIFAIIVHLVTAIPLLLWWM